MATKKTGAATAVLKNVSNGSSGATSTAPKLGVTALAGAGPIASIIQGALNAGNKTATEEQTNDGIDAELKALLDQQLASQQASVEAEYQNTLRQLNANKETVQQNFEQAQNEAYINNALGINRADDYLRAKGYSGGATESTINSLQNAYGNNRQTNENNKSTSLAAIDSSIADAATNKNSNLASLQNTYLSNLYEATAAAKDKAAAKAETEALDTYNAAQYKKIQDLQNKGYSVNVETLPSGKVNYTTGTKYTSMDVFKDTYEGKYKSESTYKNWINNLKKSNDPNASAKIAYLTQYINSNFNGAATTKTSSSSGSKSGSGSSSSGSSKSSTSSTNKTYSQTQESAKASNNVNLAKVSAYVLKNNSKMITKPTAVVSDLKSQVKSGKMTQAEANYILNKM